MGAWRQQGGVQRGRGGVRHALSASLRHGWACVRGRARHFPLPGATPSPRSTCCGMKGERWTRYGESSAFFRFDQGQIYKEALGGQSVIISPRTGMIR